MDADIRRLERQAEQGDQVARVHLERARRRAGRRSDPVLVVVAPTRINGRWTIQRGPLTARVSADNGDSRRRAAFVLGVAEDDIVDALYRARGGMDEQEWRAQRRAARIPQAAPLPELPEVDAVAWLEAHAVRLYPLTDAERVELDRELVAAMRVATLLRAEHTGTLTNAERRELEGLCKRKLHSPAYQVVAAVRDGAPRRAARRVREFLAARQRRATGAA